MVKVKISSTVLLLAEKNGISKATLRYRLSKGWDDERAATEPPRKQADSVESNKDMLALAKKNGISGLNYRNRVRYGYSELEAATIPVMDKYEKGKISGEARGGIPQELIKQASKNGITYITLYKRLKVYKPAWTEEEATTIPPLEYGEKLRKI